MNRPMLLVSAMAAVAWLDTEPLAALAGPPDEPRVIEGIEIGKPGGDMRMLIGRERETRFFNIYGYAHLISFDRDLDDRLLASLLYAGYATALSATILSLGTTEAAAAKAILDLVMPAWAVTMSLPLYVHGPPVAPADGCEEFDPPAQYHPAAHTFSGAGSPGDEQYQPGVHGMQSESAPPPVRFRNVPAGHG